MNIYFFLICDLNTSKNRTAAVERPEMFLLCQNRSHSGFLLRNLLLLNPLLLSVLWLDVMSIAGGQRLSAFGCQNGCVGLALVNQSRPGEAQVTWALIRCARWTVGRVGWSSCHWCCTCTSVIYIPHTLHLLPVCPLGFWYILPSRIIVSN